MPRINWSIGVSTRIDRTDPDACALAPAGSCEFAYTQAATPVVSSISPTSGAGSMVLTLTGTSLPGSPLVTLHPRYDAEAPPINCVANTLGTAPSTATRVECLLPPASANHVSWFIARFRGAGRGTNSWHAV